MKKLEALLIRDREKGLISHVVYICIHNIQVNTGFVLKNKKKKNTSMNLPPKATLLNIYRVKIYKKHKTPHHIPHSTSQDLNQVYIFFFHIQKV